MTWDGFIGRRISGLFFAFSFFLLLFISYSFIWGDIRLVFGRIHRKPS